MQKMHKRLTQTQMIVLGMFLVILAGALLLMLPISTRESVVTPPVDALFTAVSASCVTGLVIADTYQHWSVFPLHLKSIRECRLSDTGRVSRRKTDRKL